MVGVPGKPNGYDPYAGWDLTSRPAMFPFLAEYTNQATGEKAGGLAVPSMITEPVNALMRLIGTPNNPGTFAYGPDVGILSDNPERSQYPAQQDMRTLLETFTGGNATRGLGAVGRDTVGSEVLPNLLRRETIFDKPLGPGEAVHVSPPDNPGAFTSRFNSGDRNYGAVIAGVERNPISASNNFNIHDPPRRPQRPFEEDYPNGAQPNDAGFLRFDMEGRPLQAQYVVGRNTLGGADRAFPPSQLNALAEALLGRPPQSVAKGDIPGIAGFLPGRSNSVGSAGNIYLDRTVPSPERERALAHELGHALDYVTNSETRIPPRVGAHDNETKLLNDEYGQVYHDLASPDDATRGEARATWQQIGPQHFGYTPDQHDAEFLAEAFRAYLTDPNYMKDVAPTVAGRIRSYVNSNPDLSKIIQFNSGGHPSLWGSALQGVQDQQPYPNSLFTY